MAECANCGRAVRQTEHGTWIHETLGVTYCHTQDPETLYNNWDHRVATPKGHHENGRPL